MVAVNVSMCSTCDYMTTLCMRITYHKVNHVFMSMCSIVCTHIYMCVHNVSYKVGHVFNLVAIVYSLIHPLFANK